MCKVCLLFLSGCLAFLSSTWYQHSASSSSRHFPFRHIFGREDLTRFIHSAAWHYSATSSYLSFLKYCMKQFWVFPSLELERAKKHFSQCIHFFVHRDLEYSWDIIVISFTSIFLSVTPDSSMNSIRLSFRSSEKTYHHWIFFDFIIFFWVPTGFWTWTSNQREDLGVILFV